MPSVVSSTKLNEMGLTPDVLKVFEAAEQLQDWFDVKFCSTLNLDGAPVVQVTVGPTASIVVHYNQVKILLWETDDPDEVSVELIRENYINQVQQLQQFCG